MCMSDIQNDNFWLSKRLFVAILVFFGQITAFFSMANINIAIVEMTSSTTTTESNRTVVQDPEFLWDSQTIGWILGATSYGGLCGTVGGYLAPRFGGSTIITIASIISAITTILVPMVVRYNLYIFWLIRVLEGFSMQLKFISTAELWSQWSPLKELSKLLSIGFSGIYAGTIVVYPVCGFIIHRFGWPMVFYFTGGASLIWTLIWFLLVPNDPSCDKNISHNELMYIKQNQEQRARPIKFIPVFKEMLKSKVIFALCVIKFAYNSSFTIVVTCLPMFIKDITDAEIDEIGIFASIPNIISLFVIPPLGYVIDSLQNSGLMTVTQIHKLCIWIGFFGGSFLLFTTAYFSSILTISIICLTTFKLLISPSTVVTLCLPNYVAPKCASVVSSLADLFYHLSAIVSPMIVGVIVTQHSALEWRSCFCTFAIILVTGGILFTIFGSSEPQSWAYKVDEDSKQNEAS